MTHKTLMRSSLVAVLAASAPAMMASGVVTLHDSEAGFDAAVGAGAPSWTEDFEQFNPGSFYALVNTPQVGLGDGSVSMGVSDFFVAVSPGYWANMASTTLGVLEGRTMTMSFDGLGVSAVGMELIGTSTFSAGFFSDVDYTIFDIGGGTLASGNLVLDGSSVAFFGVDSDIAIGSIQLAGKRFGGALDAALYADNARGYNVPSPGAGMLFGVAGLAACRRRR